MNKIFFDMDWTLYNFENWQYRWSKLEKQVEENAKKLLQVLKWNSNFKKNFEEIKKTYWEEFSIAFEEIFWLDKLKYFEIVWDINPEWFINNNWEVLDLFKYLQNKWFDIFIVSESPKIWIERVLNFLKIDWIISWVYSWQWNKRKFNGLLYKQITEEIWKGYYMIWDQVQSDIIMAKNNWFKWIYINSDWKESVEADLNINRLNDLKEFI